MRSPIHRRQFLGFLTLPALGCRSFKPPIIKVEDYQNRRHSGPIRVACVGDSITYGAGIDDRESKAYPARLGAYLGSSFTVRNFGKNAATLSRQGDTPYWTSDEFKQAAEWLPDVVILHLGTNDTKPDNWKGARAFGSDLRAMLDHFRKLKPAPKIWICIPVPVYGDHWGINAATLDSGVIPELLSVCNDRKIPVIDLHDALHGKPDLFPDQIHPNAAGAELMARTIYQAIRP